MADVNPGIEGERVIDAARLRVAFTTPEVAKSTRNLAQGIRRFAERPASDPRLRASAIQCQAPVTVGDAE
jgi:hypothetical protein